MIVSFILLMVITCIAAYTDIRFQKIPNWLALAGVLAGLLSGFLSSGFAGAVQSLTGAAAGFGIMLLLHIFQAIGAGDVKLFAALGALSGVWLTLAIIIYSILFAGLIGVGLLVYRKQLFIRLWNVVVSLAGIVYAGRLRASLSFREGMLRFPFMWAVVPGVLMAVWEYWDKGEAIWRL